MKFDQEMRDALQREEIEVPEEVHLRMEELLTSLPEKAQSKTITFPLWRRMASVAACFAVMMVAVLPNASPAYAAAVEDIPVIGALVQVFTIRNYFYSDDHHELDADVPNVSDRVNPEAAALLNQNAAELTETLVSSFYEELERSGESYASLNVDHEIVTNSEEWFTLLIRVSETAGSGVENLYYYHIDRVNGVCVNFGDLFAAQSYPALEAQVLAQMTATPDEDYWAEEENVALSSRQNFYFRANGDLVIVYDEYQLGPGSLGCPEFVLSATEYGPYLADAYRLN